MFYFILFSVIQVQKQNEQLINEELIFRAFLSVKEKMNDFGNCKNSVGLKPNAEWKKDAKAPSYKIDAEWVADILLSILK